MADALCANYNETTSKFILVIMNDQDLREKLAPVLLITAIKFSRFEVVEIIYELGIYLPEKTKDRRKPPIDQNQLKQVISSIDQLGHLSGPEKTRMKAILTGKSCQKKYEHTWDVKSQTRSFLLLFIGCVLPAQLMYTLLLFNPDYLELFQVHPKYSAMKYYDDRAAIYVAISAGSFLICYLYLVLVLFCKKQNDFVLKRYQRGNAA